MESIQVKEDRDAMDFIVSVDGYLCSFRSYIHVNSEQSGMANFSEFLHVFNASPRETLQFNMGAPIKVIDEKDKPELTQALSEMVDQYFINYEDANQLNKLLVEHSLLLPDEANQDDDIALGEKEYFDLFPFKNLTQFFCDLETVINLK